VGKVSEFIINLLAKQVEQAGIIVWYDPEKNYTELARNLDIPGTDVLFYEDSFIALRRKIELFLEFIDENGKPVSNCDVPPKLIIYVPLDRNATGNALIEAESAGMVLEPKASAWQRNTRLQVIAEQVFKKITPEKASDICRQIDEGKLDLKELDRLSVDMGEIDYVIIQIIFGTSSAVDIAREFAATDQYDEKITDKNALPQLLGLFSAELGIKAENSQHLDTLKKTLWQTFFLTEFLQAIPEEKRPGNLLSIPLPDQPPHIEKIRRICESWRKRLDYIDTYKTAVGTVENELQLNTMPIPIEELFDNETFASVEKKLLDHAEQLLLKKKAAEVLKLAQKRAGMFWALQDPIFQIHWKLLENSAKVYTYSEQIRSGSMGKKMTPEQLVCLYSEGPDPWYELDTYYRHLERQYAGFELGLTGEHDTLEEVIFQVRHVYIDALNTITEAFTTAFSANDFKIDQYDTQNQIFSQYVEPLMHENVKIAYILVDALRFEMGKELIDGLAEDFEISISPVISMIPSVTATGMAALMPGAHQGLNLMEISGGKIAPAIEAFILKDRQTRVKYFQEKIDKTIDICKLNELIKPSPKRKQAIKDADIILVTSQEIDRWGEEADDESEIRIYIDEVLEKLRKSIRRLAAMEVTHIIITADHGHLFQENIEKGMHMDAPGGETRKIHRRYWIGSGGKTGEGFIRLPLKRLGYETSFEIAFPRALSCFRAKGGSTAYMHGGVSLQEIIIPLIHLERKEPKPAAGEAAQIELVLGTKKITSRFFSVTATYKLSGLYSPETIRVITRVISGNKEIGNAAMSAYGFEGSTKEISLEKGKPNPITFMLTETENIQNVWVQFLDAATQKELAKTEQIPVDIIF
jgi:hypothetical protein